MDTKDVEITYEGKKEIVTIKKLSWGEANEALRRSIKTTINGKDVDIVSQRENELLLSIIKAPFKLNIESLKQLDKQKGDKIFSEFSQLNKVTKEEEKKSESESGKTN